MTIDKQKLKALAERAVEDYPLFDHSMAFAAQAVLAVLAENERLQSAARTLEHLNYTDNGGELWKPPLGQRLDFSLVGQLKAENDLMRALIGDVGAELRRASSLICREVEAGTKSATHWAVRLRERAEHLDAAMAKEASNDR